MGKVPCSFRVNDLKRAVRAFKAAGLDVARAEFDVLTGKITLQTKASASEDESEQGNEWDEIKAPTG